MEVRSIAPVRVDHPNLCVVFNVLVDVVGQVATLIALIKNVAANDQVELAADSKVLLLWRVLAPVSMSVVHRA